VVQDFGFALFSVQTMASGGSSALHWVEEALIEAWANPAAPLPPTGSTAPSFACYEDGEQAPTTSWRRSTVDDPSSAAHGYPFYTNTETQVWIRNAPRGREL